VLAGHTALGSIETKPADFARLFDVIVSQYRHVVVDVSTRLDPIARALCDLSDAVLLVANPDLASLWNAARIREFFRGSPAEQKLRLVMNRYRKITGFGENDIEHTTQARILFKIPNKYAPIIAAIERGIPVAQTNHSDIARYFVDFGNLLVAEEPAGKPTTRRLPGL
jgi:Flp pilus assembly CpaE family ATPase